MKGRRRPIIEPHETGPWLLAHRYGACQVQYSAVRGGLRWKGLDLRRHTLLSRVRANAKRLMQPRYMWVLFAMWLAASAVAMSTMQNKMAVAREEHVSYTNFIDLSGRQRMLSQRIPLMVSSLHAGPSLEVPEESITSMLVEMEAAQEVFILADYDEANNPYAESIRAFIDGDEFSKRISDFTTAARNALDDPNQIVSLHITANNLLPYFERLTRLYETASLAADDKIGFLIDLGKILRIIFLVFLCIGVVLPAQRIINKTMKSKEGDLAKTVFAEKQSQTLLEQSPMCTKIIDLDYNLQYMSCAGITGLGIEDISKFYGKPYPLDFFPEAFKRGMTARLDEVKKTGSTATLEAAVVDIEGNEMWFHATIVPVFDDKDQLDYFLIVSADTTERHKTADALKAALTEAQAANVAKSEFLATMSHEIRTPMNGVLGMAELVLMSDLPDDVRDNVSVIQESGETLLAILSDILDLSKIEAGGVELRLLEMNVLETLADVSSLVRGQIEATEVSYTETIAEKLVSTSILGDTTRIRQVLTNLINNAIKFTRRGSIEVALSQKALDDGRIETRFEITDTGIGLSTDQQDHIFEAFYQVDQTITREYGGTGLGLSIARKLVEVMGGEIGVTSKLGEGSKFWFTVVTDRANPSATNARERLQLKDQQPAKGLPFLLVAEDNTSNQKIISLFLQTLGFEFKLVENGKHAVEAAATGAFDMVLMDINMPVMDGIEATQEIRALSGPMSALPIIAVTANAMKGDRDRYLAAGMNGYIAKPINMVKLLEVIAENTLVQNGQVSKSNVEHPLDLADSAGMVGVPQTGS